MFSLEFVQKMLDVEPGHGLLQSILLFMIWLQSKGLNKEIRALRAEFSEAKSATEKRFVSIEDRVKKLETIKGGL